MKTYCHATVSAVKASYLLAYRIAKNNKPHTIGKNLILPAAIDICTEILGKEAANKLKQYQLQTILFRDALLI